MCSMKASRIVQRKPGELKGAEETGIEYWREVQAAPFYIENCGEQNLSTKKFSLLPKTLNLFLK